MNLKSFTSATHSDLERIHRLMVKCGLAVADNTLATAVKLIHARSFIIPNTDGELAMWVGYHDFEGSRCQMSVVIAPEWQGRIMTKGITREMFEIPFNHFGVSTLRMSATNPKSVASLLSLGFNMAYDDGNVLLRKEEYERKFAMRG